MPKMFKGKKPADSIEESGDSSATPTPKKERSIRNLNVHSLFKSTSGRSTPSPSPANQDNSTTDTAPQNPKLGEQLQQEANKLWTEAYNELPSEYQQGLEHNTDSDKSDKLEALLELAMKAKKKNKESQWILKWGDKEVNVREKAEKLVGWIEKFKEVVNIAVQCDPVHAGLPWMGVRFILTACLSLFIPMRLLLTKSSKHYSWLSVNNKTCSMLS